MVVGENQRAPNVGQLLEASKRGQTAVVADSEPTPYFAFKLKVIDPAASLLSVITRQNCLNLGAPVES